MHLSKTTLGVCLLAGLLWNSGCSTTVAGSGSGSETSRTLTGEVSSSQAALSMKNAASSCAADTVLATNTSAETVSADVAEDCSFSIDLAIGSSYAISFLLEDSFVAALVFDTGITGFSGANLPISGGDSAIDLGVVTFSGSIAMAENEPLDQCDSDEDGLSDFEDDDDDGDEVDDDSESDCDLDGIWDDYEESDCEDEVSDGSPRVLEVKPRNNDDDEGDDDEMEESDRVSLGKEVKARISCIVNPETVTEETFQVASSDGETVACDYEISDDEDDAQSRIKCHHEEDFLADTEYTATLTGIQCEDGQEIPAVSWSWMTETEGDDEEDFEDLFDDEDELEDQGSDEASDDASDDESDDSDDDSDEDDSEEDEDDASGEDANS